MILVDSHCHLDMLTEAESLDLIVSRAYSNDVKYIQTICTNLQHFQTLLDITYKYPQVFTSVGIHPHEVVGENLVNHAILEDLSKHPKVIAFGETGLDYYYGYENKKNQIYSFQQHILAASNTMLPLIVHTRNAEADTIDIITNNMKTSTLCGVIHCFTSNMDFAKKMLDLGMYISISGIVTFKNADIIRDVVKFMPLDRLLIETDAPYLSPVPMRGKTNDPSFVKYIAQHVAELKNTTIDHIAAVTTENFFRLFKISNTSAKN